MKKRTITDDEFIELTLEVMKKPLISDILENSDGLVGFPLLFSAALCTELFGDPEEDNKEFKKIVSYADGNGYTFNIYTGGILKGYSAVVEVHNKITAKYESVDIADCYKFFCDYTLTKVD